MVNTNYLLTSESVSEGHPDKMADQISDGILDALLEQDPMSRVACETSLTTGLVLVFGFFGRRVLRNALAAISNLQKPIRELAKGNLGVAFEPAEHREILQSLKLVMAGRYPAICDEYLPSDPI